jgi:hypothetical protein
MEVGRELGSELALPSPIRVEEQCEQYAHRRMLPLENMEDHGIDEEGLS